MAQVALLDDVAAWLCATVITAHVEGGTEQALRILCKWIRVGYHLKELRSFNMFFAVMFGVQSLDKYETEDSTLLMDLLADFEDEDAEAYACVFLCFSLVCSVCLCALGNCRFSSCVVCPLKC